MRNAATLDALFPTIRSGVLSATLLQPEHWWFMTELARHLAVTPSSLQRELESLVASGLLLRRQDGYAYAKIYRGLEERGIVPVIPAKAELPPGPRTPMVRFKYDAKHQLVRCPRGQKLRRSTRDQDRWYYRTGFHQCRECPLRQQCLSPKVDRRTIVISDGNDALLRARRRKNRGENEFRQTYARHRWRSEGLNAEFKNRHGLHRATRRGLENMRIQSYLTACAVNLKRLAR